MKKCYYFILVLYLQPWILFSVISSTPIQSENSIPKETNLSLKTNSNGDFVRALNETHVNYNITNSQNNPSICALSSDTFAVAWESNGQDGNGYGIYARVFNANTGDNITHEFRVNYNTTQSQWFPSICALSSDKFAVAWQSLGQDGSDYGIYARVFNASTGENMTREFRVNNNIIYNQQNPSISALSSDKFAVAWQSWDQDGSLFGVYASVFNANTGDNITHEFRVNYNTTNNQQSPSTCELSSDIFAVA